MDTSRLIPEDELKLLLVPEGPLSNRPEPFVLVIPLSQPPRKGFPKTSEQREAGSCGPQLIFTHFPPHDDTFLLTHISPLADSELIFSSLQITIRAQEHQVVDSRWRQSSAFCRHHLIIIAIIAI